ncbi:MAG: sugar phosphate nucleotidyltransferase, partial [Pseudolabrys sp.]
MKTIILAGGYGTRLSEETETLPKPMIELGGHPLLWHIMHLYSAHGFDDFILALGYKGDVIKRYFLQYPQVASDLRIDMKSGVVTNQTGVVEKWKIDLIDTGHDTMTGGRLTKLRNNLTKTFFL